MKLNTILKISTPIAMVGVMTPIIASCGGNSFSFEYGDDINCFEKESGEDAIPYHSIKTIGKAAKKLADRNPPAPITMTEIKTQIKNREDAFQNCFYDLIASCTIGINDVPQPIEIKSWNGDFSATTDWPKFSFTIKFNFMTAPTTWDIVNQEIQYFQVEGKIFIEITNGSQNQSWQSYTYQDCVGSDN